MIYFWIVFVMYWIHRLGLLPFCPFCEIHTAIIRFTLKASLMAKGQKQTYFFVQVLLKNSPTSKWLIIYDALTCSNYEEEETETEQVSTDKKEKETTPKDGSTTSN